MKKKLGRPPSKPERKTQSLRINVEFPELMDSMISKEKKKGNEITYSDIVNDALTDCFIGKGLI